MAESEQQPEVAQVPTGLENTNPPLADHPSSINWTASEFVAHDKSAGWYMTLALGAILLAVLLYLLTRDIVSGTVVIVAAVLLGMYGRHQPRQLEYSLDQHGIAIGHKSYRYAEFRSFSVIPEGAFSSVVFMPLKRFMPPLSIYYDPKDEDKIVDLLSAHLPYEQTRRDMVDNLMRKIRF